jgi:hypothetical protein
LKVEIDMRQWLLSMGLGVGLLSLSPRAAMANTIELKPFPLLDTQNLRCPDKIVAYQTAKPYQEGSFTWDGTVLLGAIATQISVAKVDPFSVTWVGTLKPPYQKCRASAGVSQVDGQPSSEQSYLRMQFLGGKVYFILDMTGMRDANGYTTTILRKEIVKGNPHWQWGGTD